ncbi:cell division protein FtsL [Gilvimarinus algae]|uniref:Cell division protein FtsL n=1 Tax=Gilvimarinus algae TaxID=3058037 RepID=A0ABT8TI76_9GAMM|nr:cell division protein FtsL [Gilvimarinus sp. SDUM040014]MDO3382798.1 cell division protein FtsL [Gilvimarinus sp. SDUM040014]
MAAGAGAKSGQWVLVALLWLACLISALAVVSVTQQVRRETDRLESLRRESAELEVQWGQYLLEQSTWASYSRVEKKAREELDMHVPEAEHIILVK